MSSLFKKYILTYGLVVVASFSLLGAAFLYQVNMLAIEEKKLTIEETLRRVSESTQTYLDTKKRGTTFLSKYGNEEFYKTNLTQLASYSGASMFFTDADGVVTRTVMPGGFYEDGDGSDVIPLTAVHSVLRTGSYSEVGTLSGFLAEPHYAEGIPISYDGRLQSLVYVVIPAESSLRFFQNMTKTFFGFFIVVVFVTLITTYFIVRQTLKPIQAMSTTAQSFVRGDYSARAELPKDHDELYFLMVNFNNMADAVMKSEIEQRGLVANVSHDLRTPMTTISGFVDGILDGTIKQENQHKYLQIVSDEVKRLSRLANDMVELSRFQSGAVELNLVNFDISELVRRIIISFEQKITEKEIEVELEMPDVLNIIADRDSIFRVVYNLLDNAVKFTQQGGKIMVSLKQSSGRMVCSVENTGKPIPADEARSVFERFYKLDKSRSENKQGAGLGLYIAKTIVNQHGGDIFATGLTESTRFTFDLPMKGIKESKKD